MSNIPLSVPSLKGNEWKYVKDCIETEWVSSVGKYVDEFDDEPKPGAVCYHAPNRNEVKKIIVP